MDPVMLSILLLVLGIIFIVLEFFIPSSGALTCLAAVSIIAAIVVGFTHSLQLGAIQLLLAALLVPVMFALAVKVWPHTPLGRMILNLPPKSGEPAGQQQADNLKQLVGRTGTAASKMLPSGMVKIDGKAFDAISQGMPIEVGQIVQVVAIRDHRMVVRPVEHQLPPPTDPNDILSQPADAVGIEPLDDPLA